MAFLALAGCVDVNGGAVELSWTIQNEEGRAASCADGPLGTVQLHAEKIDGVLEILSDEWDCERLHGTTRFQIPEGRWSLGIDVTCEGGAVADVRVPDPIVREITEGDVAQLNALLIVVMDNFGSCPAGVFP